MSTVYGSIPNQLVVIDDQIYQLKQQRINLQGRWKDYENKYKESITHYDQVLKMKHQFENMIEDTVEYFKKNLYERDDRIKILKRSYENTKKVLYGSNMQETANDINVALKEIKEKNEFYAEQMDDVEKHIDWVEGEIQRLQSERSSLNV